jgi:deoxyribodipyrimidine photolyase
MSMDNFVSLRDEIEQAKALADQTAADYEAWQARRDQLVRRPINQEDLVYKTHTTEPLVHDDNVARAYSEDANDFVTREEVTQMLEVAMEIAGEESGKLERRIIELEREVERLKGSNVTPMRDKDAAAA